ncbi:MAG: hypothetical protein JXA46_19780 [Dehalococcoidales bacterium]|nr:hypothetical protein [Dehalococcoidales bacterium]
MIEISEIALNVLFESLQESHVERERGLRIKEERDRITLALDRPKERDRVISCKNQSVLIIDPGFEARVGDALIDVEDMGEGDLELVMRSR